MTFDFSQPSGSICRGSPESESQAEEFGGLVAVLRAVCFILQQWSLEVSASSHCHHHGTWGQVLIVLLWKNFYIPYRWYKRLSHDLDRVWEAKVKKAVLNSVIKLLASHVPGPGFHSHHQRKRPSIGLWWELCSASKMQLGCSILRGKGTGPFRRKRQV